MEAVLRQAHQFDLVVIGVGEEWGLMSHLFGLRAERVAAEWPGSLLMVRKHLPVAGLDPWPLDDVQAPPLIASRP